MQPQTVPREPGTAASASGRAAGVWWPRAKRVLTILFFAAVAGLLVRHAQTVEWAEVWSSVQALPIPVLALAAVLAASSHVLYSCFDLVGRRYTGHQLPVHKVMAVGFTSYAFNLNLGSLVGGVALRYRLYGRLGLPAETVTRVMALSMLANWLGYLLLAGALFAWRPLELPPDWELGSEGLRIVGVALLAAAAGWMALCMFSRRRSFAVRGHTVELPSPRMAALQLAMSCSNWMLMAGAVFVLLQGRVDYPVVLAVLLVAALAGVLTHVPAGLGVLEAVFVTLLAHEIGEAQLLAALLTYRALYYLAPLAVAAVLLVGMEAGAAGRRTAQPAHRPGLNRP